MNAYAPRTRESLSAVVASAGDHFQSKESLQLLAATASGSAVVEDDRLAAYTYLGDVLVRFMFAAKGCTDIPVSLGDMKRLDLNPARALVLATVNLKRTQGEPQANLLGDGVHTLHGSNSDMYANYLLDRAYWRSRLDRSAQGVLVALPKRDSLFFASAADPIATEKLKRLAARLFDAAGDRGLSAYLYRFDAQGWHVHERLPSAQAGAKSNLAPRLKDSPSVNATDAATHRAERDVERDEESQQDKLSLAAKGQKMVIYSILLNLLVRGLERSHVLPDLVLLALSLCVAVYALIGVVKICSGLGKTQNQKILFMVWSFFPVINLGALVYLSVKATKTLREAGWTVGFLGAKP